MPIVLDGTAGIDNNATDLSYTGTLTGGTGVVNLGSGQLFKDASGNVGIGTDAPPAGSRVAISGGALNFTETSSRDILWGTSSYVYITGNQGTGVMAFGTGSTERMRIDSSGNLLVGKTSENAALAGFAATPVTGYRATTTSGNFNICNTASASGTETLIQFRYSDVVKGGISCNGTLVAYNTSSDYRLKHDIAPMTGALAKVAALKPCTYKWNADDSEGEGFIAHELQAVVPECVTGEKDAVDAEGNPEYQGIDTSFLTATLTAAIQELKAINDAQAQTIESLTARVVALEQA